MTGHPPRPGRLTVAAHVPTCGNQLFPRCLTIRTRSISGLRIGEISPSLRAFAAGLFYDVWIP